MDNLTSLTAEVLGVALHIMRNRQFLVLALVCSLGAICRAEKCGACSVVWKPSPILIAEKAEPDSKSDYWAAATAALAEGLPLLVVVEALDSEEAHLLLRPRKALIEEGEVDDVWQGNVLCATCVQQDPKTGKWKFVLGKGKEMIIDPDATTWAFWNNPEGYNHDFFETHWLYNGYSAVGVVCYRRILYLPSPAAAAQAGAATLTRIRSIGGGCTQPAVVATWATSAPPQFCSLPSPASLSSLHLQAAAQETSRFIPEPTASTLSLLALAALLVRRRSRI